MDEHERYIRIDGRRWRCADPAIPDTLNAELVSELMSARRAVKSARKNGDDGALAAARERVHDAKLALGERGRPWWERQDENSRKERLAAATRTLLRKRDSGKTICPSDAARVAGGEAWRDLMDCAREVAFQLADEGWLEITRAGKSIKEPGAGPIRLRKRP